MYQAASVDGVRRARGRPRARARVRGGVLAIVTGRSSHLQPQPPLDA